ncbi:ATP-binding protein [Pelosinus sp. IPA-1]|uniref:sensor histidine kinase n=1 Tax=Pelosinus sp. IPA-1 TaxID=3029569 RepID=UPI002555C81D|nr:ATP-binding protein [Pelosinus sp. IPA-1]
MFHKLRLQLTLINLVIIAALFLILTIGTYFFAESQMKTHTEDFTRKIIFDIQAGIIKDIPLNGPINREDRPPNGEQRPSFPPPPGPRPDHPLIFFVKTGPSSEIFFESSTQPLEPSQLSALVEKTLDKVETTGTITSQDIYYYYCKVPLQNQPGMLLLFQNFQREKELLRSLVTALLFIGFICLLLSLGGSLYMANRAIIPIRNAWEQQKCFLADVSHELRTPLTIMQTNLEIVFDNQGETVASQYKWLHNIKEESDAMAKLVNSLLFLARADSKQPLIEKKHFSLSEAITRSLASLSPLAATKDLKLHVLVNPDIYCYGDEGTIRQVITILFDNAIRHTPASGQISLHLQQISKNIILTFSDTGEGIPPKHLGKIFDRFYQVDTSRFKGGTGLGLSIAKLIIEAHNGTIQVTSEPMVKTEFLITLPIS